MTAPRCAPALPFLLLPLPPHPVPGHLIGPARLSLASGTRGIFLSAPFLLVPIFLHCGTRIRHRTRHRAAPSHRHPSGTRGIFLSAPGTARRHAGSLPLLPFLLLPLPPHPVPGHLIGPARLSL